MHVSYIPVVGIRSILCISAISFHWGIRMIEVTLENISKYVYMYSAKMICDEIQTTPQNLYILCGIPHGAINLDQVIHSWRH